MSKRQTRRFGVLSPVFWLAATLVVVVAASLVWANGARSQQSAVTISVTAAVPVFTPRLSLVQRDQMVIFRNDTGTDLLVTATPHAPAPFRLRVPAGGSAQLRLQSPGLYHFYDEATARVIDYQAENDVVQARPGAPLPNLPNQGWIYVPGPQGAPSDSYIHVPANHDLLAPRAAVVPVGGSVVIHNHDTDAHNIVTDPADPTGAAFEVLGTNGEPALGGAERRITFTQPGLYHVYCSIHSRIVGTVGGWKVVVPRDDSATGFADGDPMEDWILVLP